jgi:prepilin-type N-terminal cleavage/methylation domain-containing protein
MQALTAGRRISRHADSRAEGRAGFTLVEVIVVLVILAILMAIAIPALTGYIDKARNDAAIAGAGAAKSAAQVIVTEAYGHPLVDSGSTYYVYRDGTIILAFKSDWTLQTAAVGGVTPAGTVSEAVNKLTGAGLGTITVTSVEATSHTVTGMTVVLPNGKTATYATDAWSVA